jgi:PmbA protein
MFEEKVLHEALKKVDQAEVFAEAGRTVTARSSKSRIEVCEEGFGRGWGVRVVSKGRVGYSFFNDPRQYKHAVDNAVSTARLAHPERMRLPGRAAYRKVKSYDCDIVKTSESALVDLVSLLDSAASENAQPLRSEASAEFTGSVIVNSEGVYAYSRESMASVYCNAQKADCVSSEFDASRRAMPRKSVERVGREAGEWAKAGAGGKPATFSGPIVLSVNALGSFLSATVSESVDGENARRGKSRWSKMLGKRVTTEALTIIEDPFIPWAVGTVAFDDEGVPTLRKEIIKDGVLKTFLYDVESARLAGAKSTGNGFREGYAGIPDIASTNIVLVPSEREEVMDVQRGVFIRELFGFHNMNPVTGDFSLNVAEGFMIGRGELGKPIRECLLVGNFFDILKSGIAFDVKDETRAWLTAPRVRFSGRLVGK